MANFLAKLPKCFRVPLLLLLAAVQTRAQFDTATVLGSVLDSSSAVIPNATVAL